MYLSFDFLIGNTMYNILFKQVFNNNTFIHNKRIYFLDNRSVSEVSSHYFNRVFFFKLNILFMLKIFICIACKFE